MRDHVDKKTGDEWRGDVRVDFPRAIPRHEIGSFLLHEKKRWEQGQHCSQLIEAIWAADLPDIKRIMAFDCGSMT